VCTDDTFDNFQAVPSSEYLCGDKIPLEAIRATVYGLLFRCQKFHDRLPHSMTIMGIAMVVS
jgi:hypothetical protein